MRKITVEAPSPTNYLSAPGTTMLCPFHQEKTDSAILRKSGEFRCIGCGARGIWEDAEIGVVTITVWDQK